MEPSLTTTAMRADVLEAVGASYDAAVHASDSASLDRYEIAGASVWLHFAGPALRAQLTPAFAHLAAPADRAATAPSLTVHLWDSASTGAPPPPLPPVPTDHADGALFHFHEPPLRAAYLPGLESLSILDCDAGVAWHWVSDASNQPYWEKASPIRQILSWWLVSRGYLQVHGGAVGTVTGGVLLVGKGGSGKSTVALSSLGSPLLYAGDDYVAVRPDSAPRVASLYNSGKLEPEHVTGRLGHLRPVLANHDRLESEKAVIYVHEHFPAQTTSGFPLRAVLVPGVRTSQKETRVVEVSRAAAFAALAPSTMVQLHTAGADIFAALSHLIQQVSCYGLELGTDIRAIPATIGDFLAREGSHA
jgi:hypothetical protein